MPTTLDLLSQNGIEYNQTTDLAHYGIKGMKWGRRKRRHPYHNMTPSEFKPKNTFALNPSNRRMPDQELRNRINRLNMEKQYRDLTKSPTGENFAKTLLKETGKQVARDVAKKAATVAVTLALESAAKNAKNPGTKVFLEAMAANGKKKK